MKPIITKLHNGVTVAAIEKPHSFMNTLAIAISAGTFNEVGFPQGTAHFVEHMLFKGTTTRSPRQINNEINSLGGRLNAFTYYEETKYYVTIPSDSWKQGFEVIMDLLANPTFPEDEIERERNVILEEIKMYADDPVSTVMDSVQAEMFKDYRERQTILGTEETVKLITREDLIRFVQTYYKPENLFFIGVGNLCHEELAEMANLYVPSYEPLEGESKIPFTPYKMEAEIDVLEDTEQAHYLMVMEAPDTYSEDTSAFEVLSLVLGANESSRLFQKIREERGLAYSIQTSTEFLSDYGIMTTYVGTSEDYFEEIQDLILEELNDIAENSITKEELVMAKAYLKGQMMSGLDSNSQMNDFLSHALIYNLPSDPIQQFEQLNSVTLEDVKRVAAKYVARDSYIVATITPKYTIDEIEETA